MHIILSTAFVCGTIGQRCTRTLIECDRLARDVQSQIHLVGSLPSWYTTFPSRRPFKFFLWKLTLWGNTLVSRAARLTSLPLAAWLVSLSWNPSCTQIWQILPPAFWKFNCSLACATQLSSTRIVILGGIEGGCWTTSDQSTRLIG